MTVTDQSVADFVDDIAGDSTLGGGSVAAVGGAMAAALSEMVCRVSLEDGDVAGARAELRDAKSELADERERLLELADEAAEAFAGAARRATSVPLEAAERCLTVLGHAVVVAAGGKESVVSDAGASGYLAHAAVRTALDTAVVNLADIDDEEFTVDAESRVEHLGTTGERLEAELRSTLGDRL